MVNRVLVMAVVLALLWVFSGCEGAHSFPAVSGDPSVQGPRGPLGSQNEPGSPDLSGNSGLPGVQGIQGEPGLPGNPGMPGIQGPAGLPGPAVPPSAIQQQFETSPSLGFSAAGGRDRVYSPAYDLTFFRNYGVNPSIDTAEDHLSTFAVDVDTASYSVARRFLQDGNLPDPNAVRVEEFVNYFNYGYEPARDEAFAVHMEGSPSPFGGEGSWLLRVGLQGRNVADWSRKDATLIFAIDVSGSMGQGNRLELAKRALELLVDELTPADKVGIVIYSDRGFVWLSPTWGSERRTILNAIDRLQPGGSTYVEDGLRLAYQMAVREVDPERITRVLLLSDGVGNVGRTGPDAILRQVGSHVDRGVTLTTVGFGMGNYNDVLMEQLANDGNGSYHYVDSLAEAHRIFVENQVGTLQLIAKDAKVQVDFNPDVVRRYRLLGYENREISDADFRDNRVDAGELGAGHSVTALYELELHEGVRGELARVFVRYENPDTGQIEQVRGMLNSSEVARYFDEASPSFQLAAVVAEYAEQLRNSYWARDGSLPRVVAEANRVLRLARWDASVGEFVNLVARTERIAG